MKPFIVFVLGAVCGTFVTAAVHHSHLVQTGDQWLVVPRASVNLTDCYADVRQWTLDDWRAHPDLAKDMVKAGHAEIIQSDHGPRVSETEIDHTSERTSTHRTAMQKSEHHRTARRHDDFDPESRPE